MAQCGIGLEVLSSGGSKEDKMETKNRNNKMTKILLTIIAVIGFSPVVQPTAFDKPFTQDIKIFMESQFSAEENAFLDEQEELYMSLVKEVEAHPDLMNSLPAQVQAELKFWQQRGKSLN